MKEITILLPSLRPFLAKEKILLFAKTNPNVNYEIIVVSPTEIKGEKVRWLPEVKRRGSVWATEVAFVYSESEYVMYFSDDVYPTNNCLKNMLTFMHNHKDPFIGAFRMLRDSGREIGPFKAYNKLYACYGCMSKKTIDKIGGGMFNPMFSYSWADIDISLRCWEAGGKVEVCPDAIVKPNQIFDNIYYEHRSRTWSKDVETFLNKWHSKLGKGLPRNAKAVNNPK